jgi:hypothetical protein
MKAGHPAYKTTVYRRLRASWLATQPLPWMCGMPRCTCPTGRRIDPNINGRSRWGVTVQHTDPRDSNPGAFLDTGRWQLAHRACNSRGGAQITNEKRWGGKPSRDW